MQKLKELNDFKLNTRICLYGTGHYGLALFQFLRTKRPDIKIVRFIDTYRTGTLFGIEIIGPDEIKKFESEFDFIVIGSDAYRHDVIDILEQKGIDSYYNFSFNPLEVELPIDDSKTPIKSNNIQNYNYQNFPQNSFYNDKILYAFYDLTVYPGSFEIIDFLVLSEMERQERNLDALHLVIVPKPNYLMSAQGKIASKSFHTDDNELVNWRIKQILLPSASLMPSCIGTTVCTSRFEAEWLFSGEKQKSHSLTFCHKNALTFCHKFPFDYTTDGSSMMLTYTPSYFQRLQNRAKISEIPSLKATKTSMDFVFDWIKLNCLTDKKIVTITLRDSPNYTKRNSTIEEWVKFAKNLDLDRFHPVFIKDTFSSFNTIISIEKESPLKQGLKMGIDILGVEHNWVFYEASWNIELRMAIYEQSYLNLFVSNGPAALCINNKETSYIIFKMLNEEYNVTSPISYERTGFPVGSQHVQATPFQKIVWSSDDNYQTILDEFNRFCELKS